MAIKGAFLYLNGSDLFVRDYRNCFSTVECNSTKGGSGKGDNILASYGYPFIVEDFVWINEIWQAS